MPQGPFSQREPLTLNTPGSVLTSPSPTPSLGQPPSCLCRLWKGLRAGLLPPPCPSHPLLSLHSTAGEIYESEIWLCHSAALNTLVTPTALQIKAKFLTVATRPSWNSSCCSCCSCSPPCLPPCLPACGAPPLWRCFVSWTMPSPLLLEPSVQSPGPGILFPSTVTCLKPIPHLGLSFNGTPSGKSSQIS